MHFLEATTDSELYWFPWKCRKCWLWVTGCAFPHVGSSKLSPQPRCPSVLPLSQFPSFSSSLRMWTNSACLSPHLIYCTQDWNVRNIYASTSHRARIQQCSRNTLFRQVRYQISVIPVLGGRGRRIGVQSQSGLHNKTLSQLSGDDLSLIPQTHSVKGENSLKLSDDLHMNITARAHMHGCT